MNDGESLSDFLQRNEDIWADGLRSVSLVAELDVDSETAAKALRYLGIKYSTLTGESNHLRRNQLLKEYPAVFLVATVNLIADRYDNGGVWPQLADALGVNNSQTLHNEWGEAFLYNLRKFNLPTFSEDKNLKQQYVSRMTLHSGIPTRTMNDYFRILTEQLAKDPNITAEDFISWAQNKIATGALYSVDVPVRHFLEFGKEFSVDLTDRCMELLSNLGDPDRTPEDVALPPRFMQEAVRLISSGQLRHSPSSKSTLRGIRPTFALDPYTNIPSLYLPSHEVSGGKSSATWSVALGQDDAMHIVTPSFWPGEPTSERFVPLSKPVRLATVDLDDPSFSMRSITFIDATNPMLFFEESGKILPRNVDLPPGRIWILIPGDSSDLESDADLNIATSVQLPIGWEGWVLILVDLAAASYVKHTPSNSERSIKSLGSAKILLEHPLTFIKTPTGAPVYSSKPTIFLPGDSEWEVSLVSSSGTELNRIKTVTADSLDLLWRGEAAGIIGEYTIKIRGPLGRGTTRSFYLAEGLQESATNSFRSIDIDGLDTATVKIKTAPEIGVESAIILDSNTTESPIAIASYRFIVSIPYAHLSYGRDKPSIHPLSLFSEDICDLPELLTFYTKESDPAYFEVSSNGVVMQREENPVYRNESYSFNLARISETLSNYPYAAITFGEDKIKLASIRPKSLFDDAKLSLDRKEVVFSGCTDTYGLRAVFYALSAPWVTPQAVEVNASRCAIPDNLVDAGSLLVFLQVVDEWSGIIELPDWPSSEKIVIIENKGWYTSGDPEESAVSSFLVGKSKTLPSHMKNIGLLWIIYARTVKLYENRTLGLADHHAVVTQINEVLARRVGDSLMEIAQSPLESNLIPHVLITSGMIWNNIDSNQEITPPEWSIRNSLAATLLSAADHEWTNDELSASVNILGDAVIDTFNGNDPYRTSGGFGPEVDVMDANESLYQQLIGSLNLVPEGLLDQDSRAKSALSIFKIRHDERIHWMRDNTTFVIESTLSILHRCGAPKEVINLFNDRLHPSDNTGWRGLAAASLGLALLSRYASRGNKYAKQFFVIEREGEYINLRDLSRQRDLDNQRNGWAEFAKLAPDAVSLDIILAEITIAGAENRKTNNATQH